MNYERRLKLERAVKQLKDIEVKIQAHAAKERADNDLRQDCTSPATDLEAALDYLNHAIDKIEKSVRP